MTLAVLVFISVSSVRPGMAQELTSVKLFDATSTFDTGPVTSAAEAVTFVRKSLLVDMQPGNTAVIASTPDGRGPIVVDNFLTINGQNACLGVPGQTFEESCFGRQESLVTGVPIETILGPIPPINISALVPVGLNSVEFELRDFGVIAGNTDLFLVTNAGVNLPTRLTPSPAALKQAFDDAIGVCRDSMTTSARVIFEDAFTQQITQPILRGLMSARTKPQIIDQIRDQLNGAKQDLSDEINDGIEASLKNINESLPPVPRSSRIVREMTGAAVPVTALNPYIPIPQISTDQSLSDILARGFDPTRLLVSWSDITATCTFAQDGGPQPVSATIIPTLGVTKACSDPDCTTDFSMAANVQSTFGEAVDMEVDCPDSVKKTTPRRPSPTVPRPPDTITIECTGKITKTPDFSAIGVVMAVTLIVLLGIWRKQTGTVPPV